VLVLVLLVVLPVVALTLARRSADHPAVVLVRDLLVSTFLIGRFLYRLLRSIYRYVSGEVRTWSLSRSSS
jgi:hypothetical protein